MAKKGRKDTEVQYVVMDLREPVVPTAEVDTGEGTWIYVDRLLAAGDVAEIVPVLLRGASSPHVREPPARQSDDVSTHRGGAYHGTLSRVCTILNILVVIGVASLVFLEKVPAGYLALALGLAIVIQATVFAATSRRSEKLLAELLRAFHRGGRR